MASALPSRRCRRRARWPIGVADQVADEGAVGTGHGQVTRVHLGRPAQYSARRPVAEPCPTPGRSWVCRPPARGSPWSPLALSEAPLARPADATWGGIPQCHRQAAPFRCQTALEVRLEHVPRVQARAQPMLIEGRGELRARMLGGIAREGEPAGCSRATNPTRRAGARSSSPPIGADPGLHTTRLAAIRRDLAWSCESLPCLPAAARSSCAVAPGAGSVVPTAYGGLPSRGPAGILSSAR